MAKFFRKAAPEHKEINAQNPKKAQKRGKIGNLMKKAQERKVQPQKKPEEGKKIQDPKEAEDGKKGLKKRNIVRKLWKGGKKKEKEGEETPTSCPICCEDPPDCPMVKLLCGCGHHICVRCIQNYLQVQIEDMQEFVICCPMEKCEFCLDSIQIEHFLSYEGYFQPTTLPLSGLLDHYHDLSIGYALAKEKETVFCPQPHCRWIALCGPQRHKCKDIRCESCNKLFCGLCKTPSHPKTPCRYDEITFIYPDMVQRCPKCTTPHLKFYGCRYAKCEKCKARFCWGCGGLVRSYRHFIRPRNQGTCRFGVWDAHRGLWPIRLYVDTDWWCRLIVAICMIIPTWIALFFYVWYKITSWWMVRTWQRMRKSCIVCRLLWTAAVTVFVFFFAIIPSCFLANFSWSFWGVVIITSVPPISQKIEPLLNGLSCFFTITGMWPELSQLVVTLKEVSKEQEQVTTVIEMDEDEEAAIEEWSGLEQTEWQESAFQETDVEDEEAVEETEVEGEEVVEETELEEYGESIQGTEADECEETELVETANYRKRKR